ncbi:hypothetical protein D3C72_1662560 [compost metagenome]
MIRVNITPKIITSKTVIVEIIDPQKPSPIPPINILAIAIKNGNLPLHGTKLLVIIAINLSLGEFIILQPITPAALHPNPIHIVNACFPDVQHLLKYLSRLKAILGKYPKSSKNVNSGKNIAIGGNITDTTHVNV